MPERLKDPFVVYKRKLPSGKFCYYYYYWHQGKRVFKSTGLSSKPKARSFAKRLYESGAFEEEPIPIVGEYFKGWFIPESCPYIASRRNSGRELTVSTVKNYRYSLVFHIIPVLGHIKINAVTTADVEILLKSIVDKELSVSTVNHVRQTLNAMYSELRRLDIVSINPIQNILRTKQKKRSKGSLSQEEADNLLSAVWKNKTAYYMVCFGYLTGMRLGELQALKWEDIDVLNRKVIHVSRSFSDNDKFKTTKTTEERYIPIFARLQSMVLFPLLTGRMSGLVFGQEKNPLLPIAKSTANNVFQAECERIGIDCKKRNITFHSLRHTAVSVMKNSGMSETMIMSVVGHETVRMSDHYTHASEETAIAALSDMQKAFEKKVNDPVENILTQMRRDSSSG